MEYERENMMEEDRRRQKVMEENEDGRVCKVM